MKNTFLIWIALVTVMTKLNGTNPMQEAATAYQSGRVVDAIHQYEVILEKEGKSAEVLYNLGNCHFHENHLGKAIVYYERAKLLKPNDPDIMHNLAIANRQVTERIEPAPDFFLLSWWKMLKGISTSRVWGIMALLCWWIGLCGFIFWRIGNTRELRKKGFIIGVSVLFFSILPFALAYSTWLSERPDRIAFVVSNEVSLRAAPDESSSIILSLKEGNKMEILDHIGDWDKVLLANGEQGWVDKRGVEAL